MLILAILATALLFGGMALHSFGVAATTLPTRQILMPAINRATQAGAKARFRRLHGLSVAITLVHMALAGHVLARFAGGPGA